MFANMAGQPCQTFECKVVGLAGPGGVDDLRRLHPQQLGDGLGGVVDLRFGSGPRLMVGVGVAGAAALYRAELCQHPFIDRGVGGIIQINHVVLFQNTCIGLPLCRGAGRAKARPERFCSNKKQLQ